MNLIRTLLAVVSFSVLLIACASPTGLAVGADSGENTPINSNNSVSTQIIANEISDLSSNANIMEQNQEVIVDSLTQMASIQSNQENMMEQFQQQLDELFGGGSANPPGAPAAGFGAATTPINGANVSKSTASSSRSIVEVPKDIDFEVLSELDTKMEFIEQLVVGQIADSALDTNDALSEITKVEKEISNVLEIEIKALRDENEKANEKALKISEDSNKEIDTEIEIINTKIIDLTNETVKNSDLSAKIYILEMENQAKTNEIFELEKELEILNKRISDFINHYNSANQYFSFIPE
ncbi:MAG: hypothetical protein ACJ0BB_01145 [Dehalococcoidia bacterium]